MNRLISTIIFNVFLFCSVTMAYADGFIDTRVSENAREWNFKVFLDDKEIGYHNFRLEEDGASEQVRSQAEFKVKFLFFTAYQYQHENSEIYRDNCLLEIDSQTDANGKDFEVEGNRIEDGFRIEANAVQNKIVPTSRDACIKTFAYWDPSFLQEEKLLNSQTGELLDVEVENVARETLTVRGQEILAQRYRLLAKNVEVDVWYSESDRSWLALESTVKGGRKLRYVLT